MIAPVVLFVFAGRKPNMELQLRWARRVLQLNPAVDYHIWNLARDPADAAWLQTLSADRITVRNEYAAAGSSPGMNLVWRHYTHPRYRGTVFVKVDDDVVFLDPYRFADLTAAARTAPGLIVGADVVNNGACGAGHPELAGCHPLRVHASNPAADWAHTWFTQRWAAAVTAPIRLAPQPGWMSINAIALNWAMTRQLAGLLGRRAPPLIAGHRPGRKRIGDEGAANLLPRAVLWGVMAAHLSFGPQHATEQQLTRWRAGYSAILDAHLAPETAGMP